MKSTTEVVLFILGMSLRGFSLLHCSLYYIQIWGMSYNEDVYINWSLSLQESSWGKQSAKIKLQ